DVEVRRDGAGAADGEAVGIAVIGVGGRVAAFNIVVGNAIGRGGGKREGGEQAQRNQGLFHGSRPLGNKGLTHPGGGPLKPRRHRDRTGAVSRRGRNSS